MLVVISGSPANSMDATWRARADSSDTPSSRATFQEGTKAWSAGCTQAQPAL
jgi:hypothetical protein